MLRTVAETSQPWQEFAPDHASREIGWTIAADHAIAMFLSVAIPQSAANCSQLLKRGFLELIQLAKRWS